MELFLLKPQFSLKMATVLDFSLPASEFKFGQVLSPGDAAVRFELERLVPLEEDVRFVRIAGAYSDEFPTAVGDAPVVDEVCQVVDGDDEAVYVLDWEHADDSLIDGMKAVDGHLLSGTGTAERWNFRLRLPSHERVSEFQDYCQQRNIEFDVKRLFDPVEMDGREAHGLTTVQRETLVAAVEAGYFAVPRETTTTELADEFDISTHAMSERLRRAVDSLIRTTLTVSG